MTMGTVFLRVINMSITASWLMAAVIVLRLLLKKAPKWLICMLWVFVAIRLVCPFSVESTWSLVPSAEPVSERRTPVRDTPQNAPLVSADMKEAEDGNAYAAENGMNDMAFSVTGTGSTQNRLTGTKDVADRTEVFGVVWICGVVGLFFYGIMSYAKLHKRTAVSAKVEGRIWQCDEIRTPFILGILRPRIYLPSDLDEAQAEYVIAHEKTHLKRRDHWWKPLGFFILTIHWFNPLCWVSYILLCRDIELACDEHVIRSGDEQYKKSYAEALLACSIGSKTITVCPLAFGETSVKERVRNIMSYKKPAFWVVLAAAAACIVIAVCFLTNPQKKGELQIGRQEDTDQQNRLEVQVQQEGNEHNTSNVAGVGANGTDSTDRSKDEMGTDADDADSRSDDMETVNGEETHDVPDVVWEQAKQYVQAAFDRTQEDYEQGIGLDNSYKEWRIENLEHCYTYDRIAGMTCEIYRLNYEFLAETPKDIVLAGGMSMSDDGWVVPESPNSNYLVFAETEVGLSYFCGMYENDCEPGDEVFTWDLLNYCNEIGLFDESEGSDPDGEELIRRFMEVDIEELHAVPYTQNIVGDYTGVGVDVTRADGLTCRAEILCIGELPDQGVRLYGYNDETYWRRGVAVEIGDDISYFDWEYMTPRIQFPKLYWNEEAQQLQITLPVYTGTSFAAEKLIVLQYHEKGVLEPNDFALDEFSALINAALDYRFDKESGMLTLIDRRTEREVGTAMLPGEMVYGIAGGDISEFVLGDTIRLRVTPGYLTNAAEPQYDGMPILEFDVDIMEMQGGRLSFLLGSLR